MSVSLNGTTQYLSRTAAVLAAPPAGFLGWLKPANATTRMAIASVSNSASSVNYMFASAAGDLVGDPGRYSSQGALNFASANTGNAFTASVWSCFAGASFASDSHAAYLNGGSPVTSAVDAGALTGLNRTAIGAIPTNGSVSQFATGLIAMVGFWDLTSWGASPAARKTAWDAAVLVMAAGGLPSLYSTGLVGFFPLLSGSLDNSGAGNDLTGNGSPTYSNDNPPVVYLSATALASDDFARSNSATAMGTSTAGWVWNPVNGVWGVTSNQGYAVSVATDPVGGASDAKAVAVIDLTSVDHYAQITIPNANAGLGPCVRFDGAARNFYMVFRSNTTTLALYRCNAGVYTLLTTWTVATLSGGETLRLEVSGSGGTVALTGKVNGATAGTFNDTSGSRIVAGLRTGVRASSVSQPFDNFEAGALSGSPIIVSPFISDWW